MTERSDQTSTSDHTPDSSGADRGSPAHIRSVLASIRDRLGFETASLFVRGERGGLKLGARVGPTRPWHVLLDPDAVALLSEHGTYANARSIPGVGLRLSGLGCGSVAVHPVPGGATLILDAAFARDDRAPDDIDVTMLGLLGSSDAADPAAAFDDTVLLGIVVNAMRRTIEIPGSTISNFLSEIRLALGVEHVVMLVEDHDHVTRVHGPIDEPYGHEAPATVDAIFRVLRPTDPIPDEHAERIASALGLVGDSFRAAYCREDGGRQLLLTSSAGAEAHSTDALALVARIAGSTHLALERRRDAIEAHLLPERSRWAHDIHDGITQVVTAAVIQLENLRHVIGSDPDAASEAIGESQDEIRKTLADLRAIMTDLSEEGEARTRRPLEDHISDIVQRWRLPARIRVEGALIDVSRSALATALVVVREALTNAAKHSSAKHVSVHVVANAGVLRLTVADNGIGFDPLVAEPDGGRLHFGIRMMRERVEEAGGTITISSTPGRGTKVSATIPAAATSGPLGGPSHG